MRRFKKFILLGGMALALNASANLSNNEINGEVFNNTVVENSIDGNQIDHTMGLKNGKKVNTQDTFDILSSMIGGPPVKETAKEKKERELRERLLDSAHDKMISEISSIVDKQYKKGYLTEKAKIKLKVNFAMQKDKSETNTSGISDGLDDNEFYRANKECIVQLNFDNNGASPYLGKDKELKLLSELKNENQRKIMRAYIALHEHYHCEFSRIKNPISAGGSNTERVNYVAKGMRDSSELGGFSSYISTLNENFADTSAIASLIKEYGANNSDLRYVAEVILAQRKDNFYQTENGVHFTHFSLESLLNPENIKKIESIEDPEDFKDFTLKIANEGTAKVFAEKKKMKDITLDGGAFFGSVMMETARTIKHQINPEEKGYEAMWAPGNSNNLIMSSVSKLLKGVDLNEFRNLDNMALSTKVKELIDQKSKQIYDDYVEYKKAMKHISAYIDEVNEPKSGNFLSNFFKEKKESPSNIEDDKVKENIFKVKENFKERVASIYSTLEEKVVDKNFVANNIQNVLNKFNADKNNPKKLTMN